ncbi:chaperonin GroEL [Patescibacteria group bacterium]|nr:chaperonin GroEL [Patescibacteria group bacterium]
MAKIIISEQKARETLKKGMDVVAGAVQVTLGPRGRNVVFDKGYGAPTITNDGVTIAKEITLKDKFQNMGAEIIKEVANKTNDAAGDGTTTATVLAHSMVTEGMGSIPKGFNSMLVRRGIEDATADAVTELKKMAKPIKGDAIQQVASISSESEEIGNIIADTINKVGKDGVLTVEESQTFGIDSDVVEGLEFDKGFVSPYMITDSERMEAEYKDALILITDKKISSVQEILPLLEKLAQSGKKELVIIADDVEGEALATFVVNKLRGSFSILAVKAPGYGDRKKEQLGDIATVVGGQVVSEDVGVKLENVELSMLGSAGRVVATKDKTTIIGGKGKKNTIKDRAAALQKQAELSDSKFDREKLEERIAGLLGGVAVIHVGAATETEIKYLKHKIEDAVNATKAAIEEGVVHGGGAAFAKVAEILRSKHEQLQDTKGMTERAVGYSIVISALSAPLNRILVNAGITKEKIASIINSVATDTVIEKGAGEPMKSENLGYNAFTNSWVPDMFKEGIIDPLKVTRTALQNAASAAAMFLTTEVAIADEPEEEKSAAPSMGGGMPDMGGMY